MTLGIVLHISCVRGIIIGYPYFVRSEHPRNIEVNRRAVFLFIGHLFFLISTIDIEEHEEVVLENTNICTNVFVRKEHVYIDPRTFFQNCINCPDRKYFHEHAGNDMALKKVRGIEIGFGKWYEIDRLVIIMSP